MVFVRVTPNVKKEYPAEVPTVENPTGIVEQEYYDPTPKKELKEVSASGKVRQYDEYTGDPLPLNTNELNEKFFRWIIKDIKSGTSPYQACVNRKIPPDIFFRKCKENKEWADELKEAREVFAESQVARLEQLSAQLKRKTLNPQIYANLSKTIIWMVERLFPALYGNKSQVEFQTTHTIEIDQDKLKQMNEMLRANQKVVEVEYQEEK